MLLAHDTCHSRDTRILFIEELQIDTKNMLEDSEGQHIFVEAPIQDSSFLLVNLYGPTKTCEQCIFFNQIAYVLEDMSVDLNCQIVIDGDFNTQLDS